MSTSPQFFTSIIEGYLSEPHASLLNGILFGIDLKASPNFYNDIKTVGLLHLVVLSGINITILCAIVSGVTHNFGKRASILITILTVVLFILFVGPKAPIVRAGVMGILTFVAIINGRRNFTLYALIISLLFITVFFPKWISTVSLQLSYAATIGIILFGQTSSKNRIWQELKISLAAQLLTTPIIFIYFRQISLIAPLSNLLVAPLIPVLMVLGFITAILGKIDYSLGLIPAQLCYGILAYIVWIIEVLADLPFIFHQFN